MASKPDRTIELPSSLESIFWDCDFSSLTWREHSSFIIRRILDSGGREAMKWLRRTAGDAAIRDWFLEKKGRGLEPRKLRFWELILDLPGDQVDEWVRREREGIWHGRHNR